MQKIPMPVPIVEMDGDEMTRIIWAQIKEMLLRPFVELNTVYYDLGLPNREATGDQVTVDAAKAILQYGVGVKCATITPNAQRMEEYHLSKLWKSPNGTIRSVLDGTVFRKPIVVKNIKPLVSRWEQPITIARHAFGDLYKAAEQRISEKGKAELVFTDENGQERRERIWDFDGAGVLQGQFNTDRSITAFAHACFRFAIDQKQDLWFSAKDTISKTYDQRFREIFQTLYETRYQADFQRLGIRYRYTLIDAAVAGVITSRGGMIWACKNYDGDVMSDMISAAFGSIAMMTSVLVSPDGKYEYEAAHGTVTDLYYRYRAGETVSVNSIATIFAWTGALKKRGELDGNDALVAFGAKLERACLDTVESGVMTGDLAAICEDGPVTRVDTEGFLRAVQQRML